MVGDEEDILGRPDRISIERTKVLEDLNANVEASWNSLNVWTTTCKNGNGKALV